MDEAPPGFSSTKCSRTLAGRPTPSSSPMPKALGLSATATWPSPSGPHKANRRRLRALRRPDTRRRGRSQATERQCRRQDPARPNATRAASQLDADHEPAWSAEGRTRRLARRTRRAFPAALCLLLQRPPARSSSSSPKPVAPGSATCASRPIWPSRCRASTRPRVCSTI